MILGTLRAFVRGVPLSRAVRRPSGTLPAVLVRCLMKATRLIEMLAAAVQKHGDLDVRGTLDPDPSEEGYAVTTRESVMWAGPAECASEQSGTMMALWVGRGVIEPSGPEESAERRYLCGLLADYHLSGMLGDGLDEQYVIGGWPDERPLNTMTTERLRLECIGLGLDDDLQARAPIGQIRLLFTSAEWSPAPDGHNAGNPLAAELVKHIRPFGADFVDRVYARREEQGVDILIRLKDDRPEALEYETTIYHGTVSAGLWAVLVAGGQAEPSDG